MMLGHTPPPTKIMFPKLPAAMAIHLGEGSLCVLCASVVNFLSEPGLGAELYSPSVGSVWGDKLPLPA